MPRTIAQESSRRRCVLCHESVERSELIRFVVSPEGTLVADLEQKLPGRGIWARACEEVLRKGLESGELAREASRAVRRRVEIDPGIVDLIASRLRERAANLLGLARKSGDLVTGFERVRELISRGEAGLLISAADAADDGYRKLTGMAPDLPVLRPFGRAELSLALGGINVVHAALKRCGLLDPITRACARTDSFSGRPDQDGGEKTEGTEPE